MLLVSKTTRLEVEQQSGPHSFDSEIREILAERGSGYLLKLHEEHKRFEDDVIRSLEKLNVEVKIVDRRVKPIGCIMRDVQKVMHIFAGRIKNLTKVLENLYFD